MEWVDLYFATFEAPFAELVGDVADERGMVWEVVSAVTGHAGRDYQAERRALVTRALDDFRASVLETLAELEEAELRHPDAG